MIHWSFLYLCSEWVIRLTMLLYVPQRRSASAARPWLLFIFLLPWPGLVIDAFVGRIRVPACRGKLQGQAGEQISKAQAQIGAQIVAKTDLPLQLQIIPQQAKRLGMFEPFGGNAFEFLRDYEGSINRLIQDIDSAAKQVHLLTYIYRTDQVGRITTDAIRQDAQRGVRCH